MQLIAAFRVLPRSRICGAMFLLPRCDFMGWRGTLLLVRYRLLKVVRRWCRSQLVTITCEEQLDASFDPTSLQYG